MKTNLKVIAAVLLAAAVSASCAGSRATDGRVSKAWQKYDSGEIVFEDKAPATEGSQIYRHIIPDPESYIREQARTVLATLYDSPKDNVPVVHRIRYTLEDTDGISAKGGSNGDIEIFYSTRHIEKSYGRECDTARLMFETAGRAPA